MNHVTMQQRCALLHDTCMECILVSVLCAGDREARLLSAMLIRELQKQAAEAFTGQASQVPHPPPLLSSHVCDHSTFSEQHKVKMVASRNNSKYNSFLLVKRRRFLIEGAPVLAGNALGVPCQV